MAYLRPPSTLHEFIAMRYEFRIGIGAELVKIQALPLLVRLGSIRKHVCQHPVQSVAHWQNETEQGGDSNNLSAELMCASSKNSNREKSPYSGDCMNRY